MKAGACVIDMQCAALVRTAHGASGWQLACTQEREHKGGLDKKCAESALAALALKNVEILYPYPPLTQ